MDKNNTKNIIIIICITLVLCIGIFILARNANSGKHTADQILQTEESVKTSRYVHNPEDNPKAMEDIEVDDTAIYGYKPNKTGSLKEYTSIDWSDPKVVEKNRQERIDYHESLSSMYDELYRMQSENCDIEEIARTISTMRNELRISSYENDPEGLEKMKIRNLEHYGHEEGPLPDELYEKYGSWEEVLIKAFSLNSGMDACLGLYDDYYNLYVVSGQIPEESN